MKENTSDSVNKVQNLIEWAESVAGAVAVIVLLFVFVVQPANVSGISMEPTLQNGDKILVRSALYQPSYGDIVVIDSYNNYQETLVKRVIGMEGDTIDIDFGQGIVYRNGKALDEPYTSALTTATGDMHFPLVVPQDAVFVMGDNRPYSKDSRYQEIGFVDQRDIMGKAFFRMIPFGNFGGIS